MEPSNPQAGAAPEPVAAAPAPVGASPVKMSRLRWLWRTFFVVFFAAAGLYVALVLVPAFKSPRSRVYASLFGYPSVQRYFGQPFDVEVEEVQMRSMVKSIAAEGQLEFLNLMPVTSEILGVITKIEVEPGQRVRKGDLLFKVHPGAYRTRMVELQREQKNWDLKQARATLERQRAMFKYQATTAKDVELAELAVKSAETQLALAEENYKQTMLSRSRSVMEGRQLNSERDYENLDVDVLAVQAGTVVQRFVQLGQNLLDEDQRTTLLVVGDRLVFQAQVDQRYAPQIKVGDQGKFYLRAWPGTAFDGEVIRIDATVQSDPRTLPGPQVSTLTLARSTITVYPYTFSVWLAIKADVAEKHGMLRGMNGYCVFERPYTSLAISQGALMRYSGRTGSVMTVDGNDQIQIKQVGYSGTDDGWVAVDTGINRGDRVVIDGQIGLKPGDTVNVRRPEGAAGK